MTLIELRDGPWAGLSITLQPTQDWRDITLRELSGGVVVVSHYKSYLLDGRFVGIHQFDRKQSPPVFPDVMRNYGAISDDVYTGIMDTNAGTFWHTRNPKVLAAYGKLIKAMIADMQGKFAEVENKRANRSD